MKKGNTYQVTGNRGNSSKELELNYMEFNSTSVSVQVPVEMKVVLPLTTSPPETCYFCYSVTFLKNGHKMVIENKVKERK